MYPPVGNSSNSFAASTSASPILPPLRERFLASSPEVRCTFHVHSLASSYWPLLPRELYSPLMLDRLFDPLIRSPAAFSTLSYSPVDCLDWDGGMGDAFRDVGSDEAWDRLLDLPGKNDEVSEPDASSSSSSPSSSSSSSSTISVISESWMKLTISE